MRGASGEGDAGMRDFDPGRSAEVEFGMRNSTRGGERGRTSGRGFRSGAECGDGNRDAGRVRGTSSSEIEQGRDSVFSSRLCSFLVPLPPSPSEVPHSSSALRPGSSSAFRTPPPHSAPGRVPHPKLHLRTPHRGEFRIPRSSFALRAGANSPRSPLSSPCRQFRVPRLTSNSALRRHFGQMSHSRLRA